MRTALRTVILFGVFYTAVGIAFGALAGSAASDHARALWRLAAWILSAAAFGAQVWYERVRLRNPPRVSAWHASAAAALGAFGLAVAANIHALGAVGAHRPRLLVALAAWPILCGLPAFVIAWAAAAGLAFMRRGE